MKTMMIFALAVLLILPLGGTAAAAPPLQLVQGGGTNYYVGDANVFMSNGLLTTLAFTARQIEPDGPDPNATGRFYFKIRYDEDVYFFFAEILYLSVDGTDAWLGIRVARSSSQQFWPGVGSEWIVRVRDNGKGSNLPPDRISSFYGYPAEYALTQPNLAIQEQCNWENGDIQIK